jgi:hypothetical protein
MKIAVDLFQTLQIDVRIDLCSGDIDMSEHLLNTSPIPPSYELPTTNSELHCHTTLALKLTLYTIYTIKYRPMFVNQLTNHYYEPRTTNYQLPTTNYQLPTTNYQLPTTNYQLISLPQLPCHTCIEGYSIHNIHYQTPSFFSVA